MDYPHRQWVIHTPTDGQIILYKARLNLDELHLTVWTVKPCHASAKRRVCRNRHRDASLRSAWQGCVFLLVRNCQVHLNHALIKILIGKRGALGIDGECFAYSYPSTHGPSVKAAFYTSKL